MNDGKHHLTEHELEEYADSAMTADARAEAERHLADCPACARRVAALRTVGEAIRVLPLEKPDASLTDQILERLTGRKPSRMFTLAGVLSGLIGLVFVGGVVFAAFLAAGVVQPADVSSGRTVVEDQLNVGWSAVSNAAGAVAGWLGIKVPTGSSMTVIVFAMVVITLLGLVDRLLGRRALRGQGAQ